jgi:hypothetical protein
MGRARGGTPSTRTSYFCLRCQRVFFRSFLCFFFRIFLRRFLTRDGKLRPFQLFEREPKECKGTRPGPCRRGRSRPGQSVPNRFRRSIRRMWKVSSSRTEPSFSALGASETGEMSRRTPSSDECSR